MTAKRLGECVIVALILVSAFELGFFFKVRGSAGLYRSGDSFPLPSGYLLDQAYMPADTAPCYLIRVSADGCPYCRLDQPQYTRIMRQAQKVHCQAILLAPKTGEIKSNGNTGGVMQLQYVDMNFGRALVPFVTPETILLNRKGRIIWDQVGSVNGAAINAALSALRKTR